MTVRSLTFEVHCAPCGEDVGVRIVGVEHPENANWTKVHLRCDQCGDRTTATFGIRPAAVVTVPSNRPQEGAAA